MEFDRGYTLRRPVWISTWLLACALLTHCAVSDTEPGDAADTTAPESEQPAEVAEDPGTTGSGTIEAVPPEPAEPRPEAVADSENPPIPAEPCGEDLDADYGQLAPDMGSLPEPRSWSGDLLEAGAYQVVTTTHTLDNPDPSLEALPVTIYSPSEDGSEVAPGQHPLVLVMPGYGKGLGLLLSGLHPTYAFFSEHLASHGFVVVGMNFAAGGIGLPAFSTANLGAHFLTEQEKNVVEVRTVLDWSLDRSPSAASIDATKIAIAGHSQGGKLAFMTAAGDPRIDLVIGWDPQNAGGGPPCLGAPDTCNRLPVAPNCQSDEAGRLHEMASETLVFAARDAGSMPDTHQWAEEFYRGAPSPAHMLLFPDASHESWSDGDNPVSQLTMRTQLALLLTRFQNVQGLEAHLPEGSEVNLDEGTLEQFSK